MAHKNKADIADELLALVPGDSAPVSNVALRQNLSQALGREVEEYEYATARDQLIAQGLLVKSKGRGGSVRRAQRVAVRLANGKTLVLEIKGEDSDQDRAKRSALDAWVKAVNAKGGFGKWCWTVALEPSQVHDVLRQAAAN